MRTVSTLDLKATPVPYPSDRSSSDTHLKAPARGFPKSDLRSSRMTDRIVKSWLISTYSKNRRKPANDRAVVPSPASPCKNARVPANVDIAVSAECAKALLLRHEWDFNIFDLERLSPHFDFLLVSSVFRDWDFFEKFNVRVPTLQAFVDKVKQGYRKNPYHNFTHALDIFQTVHFLLLSLPPGLLDLCEAFALLVSALVHDLGHDGFNNTFHVRTFSSLALHHNDISPQENHHLVLTFNILHESEYNILAGLTHAEYLRFRSFMINAVLRTDMSYHFETESQFKTLSMNIQSVGLSKATHNSSHLLGAGILHLADISNPAKTFDLAKAWAGKVISEFHTQGDKERALGVPISPMCDRNSNVSIATGQIGFINFVVRPYFITMANLIPALSTAIKHLDANLGMWKTLEGKSMADLFSGENN